MAKLVDIKAAVELMDVTNDDQWNADGTPKVEVVRENLKDSKVSEEDVLKAIGEFRRPAQANPPEASGPSVDEDRSDEVFVEKDETQLLLDRVKEIRAERDRIGNLIETEHAKISEANREIARLTREQDKCISFLEKNEAQVTFAESVKRIQQQTVERLAGNVAASKQMATVLAGTGQAVVFPSALDASMAMRKRTPDQQQNYAKFVHQNAAHRNAARG